MSTPRPAEVQCYSGYRADERPARFHLDNEEYRVAEVLERWTAPEEEGFRVREEGGRVFVLRRSRRRDTWTAEEWRTS